jgi:G:T-mismatch repair DNA endonuclease (very short patch repair protein)
MRNLCKCGCGIFLRKDNRTGYQKGHKPCPVCGSLVKGSGLECCSKSCSAKLHWQRNPEMKESRIWNSERYATREKNRDQWINNLSAACKGRTPWNKGTKGLQEPWNKFLPAEQQPFYGKKHNKEYYDKRDKTVFERYGVKFATELAKSSPRSKKEKRLENLLKGYYTNKRVGPYKPDYLNEETKHIIEVYGDYWHCNPKLFKEDFYHSQLKQTAAEKWMADDQRKTYLESLGYIVTVVWESDLDKFIEQMK